MKCGNWYVTISMFCHLVLHEKRPPVEAGGLSLCWVHPRRPIETPQRPQLSKRQRELRLAWIVLNTVDRRIRLATADLDQVDGDDGGTNPAAAMPPANVISHLDKPSASIHRITHLLSANLPRSALRKRAAFPFLEISRMIAVYNVACGVAPPGDFQ